jgi:hypothetical protein
MALLSQQQLDTLRANYARIERIDPASASYQSLIGKLNKYPQEVLQQLAGANIKFLSGLARNRFKSTTEDASPSSVHSDIINQLKSEIRQVSTITDEQAYKRVVRQLLVRKPVIPAAQVEQFTRRFLQAYPYSQYRIAKKTGDMRTSQVAERDNREDDEHGGGPTPWQNPDKGWKGVVEGKEDKIKQLKQDYANKLRWSKETNDPAQQRQHRIGAGTIASHLKKQYGIDVNQGVTEADDVEDFDQTIDATDGEENPRDIEKEVPSELDLDWISKFDLGEIKEAIQKIIDHLSDTDDEEQIELLRNDIRILDNLHGALGKKDSAAVDKYWKIAQDSGSHEHLHPEFTKRMGDATALVSVKEGYVAETVTFKDKAKWDKAAKQYRVKATGKSETAFCKETGAMMGRWASEKGWLESC